MNIQAKVALDKEKHPERFCPAPRCLWKTVQLNHATQTFEPKADCPGGYCPQHQNRRPVTRGGDDVFETLRREFFKGEETTHAIS